MNKIILATIILICVNGHSQHFSESEKLAATCKVWGFLKYYHPKVANGALNWDKQLFDVLPKIEHAKNKEEFSLVLENWIASLGEIKKVEPIIQPKDTLYFDKNFDLSWIDKNKNFSKNLSKNLRFVERNRHQGSQYYVNAFQANNISIRNEDFSSLKYENKNDRILAMFMYWNLIEYFYPYKYLMDVKWDNTLEQMLPLFIDAKNQDEFLISFQKLTVRINDSHAVFHQYGKKRGHFLPIITKIIDEKMIVTEILDSTVVKTDGIKTGDLIIKINDKEITEIIQRQRSLISASNEASFLNKITEPILSGIEDFIKLNVRNMTNEKWSIVSYDMMPNIDDSNIYDMTFDVNLMGLPEHSYYDNAELVGEFQNLMAEFFNTLYPNESPADHQKRAAAIIEFEKKFKMVYPFPAEFRQRYTQPRKISREDILKKTDKLKLESFFKTNVPDKTLLREFVPESFEFLQKELS